MEPRQRRVHWLLHEETRPEGLYRDERLCLRQVAGPLLSRRREQETPARLLRAVLQYGRDQQQLLSPAKTIDDQTMAEAGAGGFPAGAENLALYHASQAA